MSKVYSAILGTSLLFLGANISQVTIEQNLRAKDFKSIETKIDAELETKKTLPAEESPKSPVKKREYLYPDPMNLFEEEVVIEVAYERL